MVRKIPWVDRTFDFNFAIGVFPCIFERLSGTPARINEMVRGVPQTLLTTRVDDSWSIQENIGHLIDVEELHEGRVEDFLSGAKVLRSADMRNRKTHEANHNGKSIQDLLNQFRISRHRFVSRLEELTEAQVALVSIHPRLNKPMRLVDMAFFVAEHDDHHLARITQLADMLQT